MNKTPNYQLSQWEADDEVLRADFNADNAKIDAAIKAVDQRVDGLSASKANASEVPRLEGLIAARADIVIGTYTGDGQALRFVNLGFTPKALLIMDEYGEARHDNTIFGGLVVPGIKLRINTLALEIVEGGFHIGTGDRVATNMAGRKFSYLALR